MRPWQSIFDITPCLCYSSKIDCKEQNGYANIKPDIGAAPVSAMAAAGWGGSPGAGAGAGSVPGVGGVAAPRVGVSTPPAEAMTRYTPSTMADQVARDRAWMNTCSSLSAAAQELNQHQQTTLKSQKYPISCLKDI